MFASLPQKIFFTAEIAECAETERFKVWTCVVTEVFHHQGTKTQRKQEYFLGG